MNVKLLNASIDALKEDLGGALIASNIWITGTGQAIVAYNANPKGTALFEQVTDYIKNTLNKVGFPGLNKYYLLDLDEDLLIVVLQFEKHQWSMLVNSKKVQLGLLLNVAIPNAIEALNKALK